MPYCIETDKEWKNMEALERVLRQIGDIPQVEPTELNFYAIGGAGYLENPTSDLMAMFMGSERQAPRWLARALLTCLADKRLVDSALVDSVDWGSVSAEREVAHAEQETDSVKRLDLVVTDGNFVLGIENKVYASARENPFHVYDRLLVDRAVGGPVIRCVLRPTNKNSDLPDNCHWPVVSYSELVKVALYQMEEEFARSPLSKWHVFYREFLNHLDTLANPQITAIMTDEALEFTLKNFRELNQAADLFERFESQLESDAKRRVLARLSSMATGDVKVRSRRKLWPNLAERVVEVIPEGWGDYSKVGLVYGQNDPGEDQGAYFYVVGYVTFGSEKRSIDEIRQRFIADITGETMSWRADPGSAPETHLWEEGRPARYLGMSGMPAERTLSGALQALEDLAAWMQQYVFGPVR